MKNSYLATMTLFVLHQMDAAYWHEWNMFLDIPPGGIQGYLAYNLVLMPIFFVGYKSVIESSAHAFRYSYFCGGIGVLVFVVHAGFMISGYDEFRLPFSMSIIALCLLSGSWQVRQTFLASRNGQK